MFSTQAWAAHYGLPLNTPEDFVQGYVDAMRLDAKGQGKPCGRGFIAPGKKCSTKGRQQLASDLRAGDAKAKARVATGKRNAMTQQAARRKLANEWENEVKAREKTRKLANEWGREAKAEMKKQAQEKQAGGGSETKTSKALKRGENVRGRSTTNTRVTPGVDPVRQAVREASARGATEGSQRRRIAAFRPDLVGKSKAEQAKALEAEQPATPKRKRSPKPKQRKPKST
jgi:hypothetical protein